MQLLIFVLFVGEVVKTTGQRTLRYEGLVLPPVGGSARLRLSAVRGAETR